MKTRTKIIWGILVAGMAVGTVTWYLTRTPEAPFSTEAAARETVARTVSVTGELVPSEYVDLSFLRVGIVREIAVSEGDTVKSGQTLAVLDSSTLEAQLREARLAVSVAEENEKLARRIWDTLSPEEKEAKKLATEQARQAVRTILVQIGQDRIVSPIDGTVSRVDIREGETALAGSAVIRVSSASGVFELESRVPEADITELGPGMAAVVTFDSLSNDETFPATITESDIAATVVQDVVSYMVTFSLDRDDDRLREGMSATIDIETEKAEDVVTVPFRAIVREDGRTYVELPRGTESERREVVIGVEGDEGLIEVKSGLSEGEEVIVSRKK